MTGEFNAIRVMIADEQATFRQTLRMFLEPEPDVVIVGEASDASCVPDLTWQLQPDVLLIDIALFGDLKVREEALPGIMALVTIPTHDRMHVLRAFLQGARAIVPKPSAPLIWSESIRSVVAGHYWLEDESIAILVQELRDCFFHQTEPQLLKDYGLTAREVQIIDKIADGHSNKEVGQAFSICERTVKHHLTNIFTKVGVSSRLELGLFAINCRLQDSAQSIRKSMPAAGTNRLEQ